MKKLFLLIPALVISMMMSAKEIQISSGTSNIIHYTIAASTTSDGDVIVLTSDGDQPYFSTAGEDDYTKLVKDLTIKAADGVHPVVKLEVPFRSTGGKTVKFIGITFDGTSLTGYDFYFRFYDANDNLEFEDCEFKNISKYVFDVYTGKSANSLKLTNCRLHDISSRGILNRGTLTSLEINGGQIYNFTGYPVLDNYDGATLGKVKINGTEFYNNAKDIISGVATSHADSCIINNCYFHNNSRSAVYFAASSVSGVETCDGVIVKNSTFANNDLSASSRSVIDVFNNGETEVANVEVTVDHCTFYNNTTKNYDYSCIRSRKSTKVNITNSIFAYPSAIEFYATNCYGGTISNTLVYNLNKGHRKSGGNPAVSNTITDAPLFTDAANGDYSYSGNWVTPSVSPARGAATDGSDLGDPRWYSAEVLPNVDFATAYQFVGAKALLAGKIWYDNVNECLYGDGAHNQYYGTATWKFHATKACVVELSLNLNSESPSVHKLRVEVLDADGNNIGEYAEQTSTLPGTLTIPAAGDYKIILHDDQEWSSAKVDNITLAYIGGAVQAMPGTTNINEAWFSAEGTRAAGKIDFPDGYIQDGWVKWNVHFANAASYKVKVNINSANGHNYTVGLYNGEDDPTPITWEEGGQTEDASPLDLGSKEVPAGDYILKVTNATPYSDAELISVQFIYEGGAVITLPGTLTLMEAVLSPLAYKEDGTNYIHFTDDNHVSQVPDQWAKWNVQAATGVYTFTFNVASTNYGKYVITINDDANNEVYTHEYDHEGDGSYTSESIVLMEGNYTVLMQNLQGHSKGYITNIYATQDESIFVLDENQTDNGSIIALDGVKRKLKLMRSFTANKYYTLCIPIDSYDEELAGIFGAGYELWGISTAEQVGDEINLNFEQIAGNNFVNSTPYIIKPTVNVENPTFSNHTFHVNGTTKARTAADFVGTFYKSEIPAGENNLYLQNNNLYYNESDATPIKGTRAWIRLKPQGGANNVKAARIVLGGKVATDISLVNGELVDGTVKTIENGQLVIIRDGVRYNVMGVKLQ